MRFAVDLLATLPLVALYAARLAANEVPKMALFARQYAGVPFDEFRDVAARFARERIPSLTRPSAMNRLRFHKDSGDHVVVVSASIEDWVEPWAREQGVDEVIASRVEVSEGRLTGRLEGPNCYGDEKLRRLLGRFPDRSSYELYVYGDSRGDNAILQAADRAFYRRFA